MRLAPGSDRQTHAVRFGLELRRALASRGTSIRAYAASSGLARSRIQNWTCGTSLPPVATAERVATDLMWPKLVTLARAGRVRSCDECRREFVQESPTPQRYCSQECVRQHAKVVAGSKDLSRAVLERRARRLSAAVGAMCAACEPTGICATPECPLQIAGVSPHQTRRESVA